MSGRPLAGLRVIDLTRLLPGGYCTLLMADLGADVVKVEEPGRGDYSRWAPPYAATGESGLHLALNRGKRSLTCDLRLDAGREVLLDLVRTADVLVESFRPGVMQRLGLGYDVLRTVNPRLVYVAVTGYGQDGPYAARAGHDLNYLGVVGALALGGSAERGPCLPGLQMADAAGGLHALVAALVALRVRDASGHGQLCDVALTEAVLSTTAVAAGAFAATGVAPRPGGEALTGGLACYGTYRCADDRWLAVGALEPKFFAALCDRLGLPELVEAQYDDARQPELRARLAEAFAARPRDEWVGLLGEDDTCVTPVNDLAEAFADPHLRSRDAVVDTVLSDGTRFSALGVVPRLTGTPGRPGRPPSVLGADTDAVLAEIGWTPERVAAAREAGAI